MWVHPRGLHADTPAAVLVACTPTQRLRAYYRYGLSISCRTTLLSYTFKERLWGKDYRVKTVEKTRPQRPLGQPS